MFPSQLYLVDTIIEATKDKRKIHENHNNMDEV